MCLLAVPYEACRRRRIDRLPLHFIAISGCCCCLFVPALWIVCSICEHLPIISAFCHLIAYRYAPWHLALFQLHFICMEKLQSCERIYTCMGNEIWYSIEVETEKKKFNKSTRVQWMRTMTDISLGTRMFQMRFTFNTFSIHISGFFSPWYFNDEKICRRVKNYLMSESVANVVYAASAYYVWHVMILYIGRKNPAPIKCAAHRRHRGPTRCYHCSIRMQKQMSAVDFVPFGFQHL